MQNGIVALIVTACTAYACWALVPSAWRRGATRMALGWPWTRRIAPLERLLRVRVQAHMQAGGCACSGCDQASKPKGDGVSAQPIRIHRRHNI